MEFVCQHYWWKYIYKDQVMDKDSFIGEQFEMLNRPYIIDIENSRPGHDQLPASIAKQCIDNYVVPLTYLINMSLIESIFLSELKLV